MKVVKSKLVVLVIPVLALAISACGAFSTAQPAPDIQPPMSQEAELPGVIEEASQVRLDEQGAVVVEVTPVNLQNPGETLDFQVAMNTHSVDLSMDLVVLATLTTDTGLVVTATAWDAPAGGHHVSGTLSFPATQSGASVLNGVKQLTLTLVDIDVPQREFVWDR